VELSGALSDARTTRVLALREFHRTPERVVTDRAREQERSLALQRAVAH
jgi:hypothetical protein